MGSFLTRVTRNISSGVSVIRHKVPVGAWSWLNNVGYILSGSYYSRDFQISDGQTSVDISLNCEPNQGGQSRSATVLFDCENGSTVLEQTVQQAGTITHTVTYHPGNGYPVSGSPFTVNQGGNHTVRSSGSWNVGWGLSGWSTTEGGNVSYIVGQTIQVNQDMDLYAVWSPVTVRIRIFWVNTEEPAIVEYVPVNSTFIFPDYAGGQMTMFAGYFNPSLPEEIYHEGDSIQVGIDNLDFYTLYDISGSEFQYTLNLNGGYSTDAIDMPSGSYPSGTFIHLPLNVYREGYDFNGWVSDVELIENINDSNGFYLRRDTVIDATWTVKSYPAVYDYNDGSGDSYEMDYNYGSVFVLPAPPVRPGYAFDGWVDDLTHTVWPAGSNYTPGMPAHTLNFTAQWTGDSTPTYQLSYDLDGGSIANNNGGTAPGYYPSGQTITAPVYSPEKDGFYFMYWRRSDTNQQVNNGATFLFPEHDVTLVACYQQAE